MTRRLLVSLAATWLALAAFVGYETIAIRRQHAEIDTQRAALGQLESEATALRHRQATLAAELAEASRQLGALPTPPADLHASSEGEADRLQSKVWLASVKRLRQLFDERPEQRIPELALLRDEDWLRIAQRHRFDSEKAVRKALADARTTALGHFARQLAAAIRIHLRTSNGARPVSAAALAAGFSMPVDPAIFDGYEIVDGKPSPASSGSPWLVRNKAPVDPMYDTRYQIGAQGSVSSSLGPWAWFPGLREQTQSATENYRRVHVGVSPAAFAEIVPYFDPPLDPAIAEALLELERNARP